MNIDMNIIKKKFKESMYNLVEKIQEKQSYCTIYGEDKAICEVDVFFVDNTYICVADPNDGVYLFRPLRYLDNYDMIIELDDDITIYGDTELIQIDIFNFDINMYL